jgi:hypothetical protein
LLTTFTAYLVVAIAAIAFPYRRKVLFESSPDIVKATRGGFISVGPLPFSALIPPGAGWVASGLPTAATSRGLLRDHYLERAEP